MTLGSKAYHEVSTKEYVLYSLAGAVGFVILTLPLAGLAPLDEPKVYAYGNAYYNLGIPVGISFSAFINLTIFIVGVLLFWGSGSLAKNLVIDSSALSFASLNYLNYYLIWYVWHPQMTFLPLFVEIRYNGVSALQLDLGQVVLIILVYRLIKRARRPRPQSGLDSVNPVNESPQPGGVQK